MGGVGCTLGRRSNQKCPPDTRTYVTCGKKAEFEPQRPCLVSQDIHTLCIDVTKETSQWHCWRPEKKEKKKEREQRLCACFCCCYSETRSLRLSHGQLRRLRGRNMDFKLKSIRSVSSWHSHRPCFIMVASHQHPLKNTSFPVCQFQNCFSVT